MNLLVKKFKVAAVVLLAPLFFVSCEDPGKIGLNVDPKNSVIRAKYKEFVLPSTQVQFNPRSTTNSSSLQAGTYSDLDFGKVTSQSYAWLGVQGETPALDPVSATYVNTTLSIQFSSFYGSEGENQEIESFDIHQLDGEIDANTDYNRTDNIAVGPVIGSLAILIQENDTIRTDSIFTIDISDNFGEDIFDKLKAGDAVFDNDTVFNMYIKGIGIIANSSNNKILQFSSSNFRIKINYTETNSAGEIVDRSYSLSLGSKRFYHLTSDLNGTPLSGISPDNTEFIPNDDFRYMQAGTLISLKINYSPVIDFFEEELASDTVQSVIIQKATLSLGAVSENKPGARFPSSLIGYFTNETNIWPAPTEGSTDSITFYSTLQSEFITDRTPVYPGFYSVPQDIIFGISDTLTYEATMSNFMQNLITGKYDTDDTPLEPKGKLFIFPPTSVSTPQSAPSQSQTHFFKVHKDSIRVKIYYSTSNF